MPFHLAKMPDRLYRVCMGNEPLAYVPLSRLREHPARWDDRRSRFRTGYFGDSLATCFIELLANLRPDPVALADLRNIGGPLPDMGAAIVELLTPRSAATVLTQQQQIVDILHIHSRTEYAARAGRRTVPRIGDFLAANLRIPRQAAGIVYDNGESGIRAASAEAFAITTGNVGTTYGVFETHLNANQARASLHPHIVEAALRANAELSVARAFLGI